jgi:hypothetical protein
MVFFWFIIPILVLMVVVGRRHRREEDDSDDFHGNPQYEVDENLEEEEGNEEGNVGHKDLSRPLWQFVTKVEDGRGGGSIKFVCPHNCHDGKPYTGSYTRLRRHLCGVMESDDNKGSTGITVCPNISKEQRQKYIKIEETAQKRYGKKQKLQSDASSRFGGNTSPSQCGTGSGTSGSRRTIADFLDIGGRDEVDAKVARFLYACGVPFNVLRSPYWHDVVKAINEAPKGYKSPSYEKARTVLLDREKAKVQRALTRFTDEWSDIGVSIVSDGWTNVRNQHLINVLGVSASGAMFLAAHDSSSIIASSQNISELLLKTINDVGPSNVIQVIIDNAANCKGAGKIIERAHPHIFWSGCLVHTLNLLMHDIVKHRECGWINQLYKKGKQLIKFITGHTRVNYFYSTHSKLQLLKIATTRFASYYLTFRRLLKVRQALGAMVMSDEWDELSNDREGATTVKETVLDSQFWSQVRFVLQFTKPIYHMIKFADSDRPIIGEVYEQMDSMLGQIKDIVQPKDVNLYNHIRVEVEKRWEMLNIPLHALAYVLTPKYYHVSWLSSPAPGGGTKKRPHQDPEVQAGYMKALDKLVPDEEECDNIRKQLSHYILSNGAFGTNHAIRDRGNLSSLEWWNMHGGSAPQLQSLATRVLSQVVNTSSAERCWSTYSFIHSVKRNRLNVSRAESLVYVHYNLRLLSHYCKEAQMDQNMRRWDNNPEEDNLEDGVLLLEQLEGVLLDDDDHVEMGPPSSARAPMSRIPATTVGASSSAQFQPSASTSALPPRGGPRGTRGGGRRT